MNALQRDQHESKSEPNDEVLGGLTQLIESVKAAIEQKDWRGIVNRLGLSQISVTGHPEDVDQIIGKLAPLTEDLCDFEAVLLKINRSDIEADRARFSFVLRVMWSSSKDWE